MERGSANASVCVASTSRRKGLLIVDVSTAFFEAPAKRDVCVELPEEAPEKGETVLNTVGKLEASLYGARDASANWHEEVAKSILCVGVHRRKIQSMHVPTPDGKDPMFGPRGRLRLRRRARGPEVDEREVRRKVRDKTTIVGTNMAAGEAPEARPERCRRQEF